MADKEKPGNSESKRRSETSLGPKELAATKQYSSPDEIDIDLARYRSELAHAEPYPAWLYALIGVAGAGAGYLLGWVFFHSPVPSLPQIAIILLGGAVAPLVTFGARQTHLGSLRAAVDILEVRKRNMTPGLGSTNRASYGEFLQDSAGKQMGAAVQKTPSRDTAYFDSLVDINVKNLGDYYVLVRLHNDKSFSVSVGVGILGFVLILAAVGFALLPGNKLTLPAAISAGSGVITEFISAVFFYLYNRSVREMRDYFDSLLTVQNILLSLKLVTDTKDDKEKVKMVGLMLSYLVDRKTIGARKFVGGTFDDQAKPRAQKAAERAATPQS